MTTKLLERFNWPEPFEYAHLPKPKHLELRLIASVDGTRPRAAATDGSCHRDLL